MRLFFLQLQWTHVSGTGARLTCETPYEKSSMPRPTIEEERNHELKPIPCSMAILLLSMKLWAVVKYLVLIGPNIFDNSVLEEPRQCEMAGLKRWNSKRSEAR